jgi:hypothetical protein
MKWNLRLTRSVFGALAIVTCLPLFATAAQSENAAQPAARRAWEWTREERIAARRDPALRRKRAAEASELQRQMALQNVGVADDIIDGKRNPELFLTTELFEELVRSWAGMPDVWPTIMGQRATDLFKDPAEWELFAAIAGEYTALLRQERAAAQALDGKRVSEVHALKCATAARALREARREFGRERFDRMLYEAVAPFLLSASGSSPDGRDWAIEREEACQ